MPRPTRAEIEERMRKGEVPGVSIAYLDSKKATPIESVVLGTTDVHASTPHIPVEQDTVFGAASLSKPVFSYLVLKLIADKKLSTADGKPFDLDTPISEILPIDDFYRDVLGTEVGREFSEQAKKITARMVLSHTTGIPINGAPRVDFEPGTQYAYGNAALYYLQKAIEKQTGQSLETLAQAEVFSPLGMTHSSFLPPAKEGSTPQAIAANSLHTTASDYARFAAAWMEEKDCSLVKMSVAPTPENQKDSASSRYILTETGFFYYNKSKGTVQTIELDEAGSKLADLHSQFSDVTEDKPIERLSDKALSEITAVTGHTNPLQEAFRPAIPLTKDQWAIDMGVAEEDRQHLAWGLGLGLQLDDTGEVTTAFHSGDMNQWRGWVAMDVKEKSAVVYFANGSDAKNGSGHGYGHVLADAIVAPEVELTHGLDWFFQKFGVSRDVEPGWKAKEETDTAHIGAYVRSCFQTRTFRYTNTDSPTLDEVSGSYKLTEAELARGDRILYIHAPPPSLTGDKPGILVLMDGDQEIHTGEGLKSTPTILEELYESKQISPQVTVFIPPGPEGRVSEYACSSKFTEFLNSKLVPLLRSPPAAGGFGCSTAREQTTIGGTSFGGLAATHAALTHPETFGNVLSQSGAFWWHKDWPGTFDGSEATKKSEEALAMQWFREIPHTAGLPIKFYLSGGEIEEAMTPSLGGESYPGAITLNNRLGLALETMGHRVLSHKVGAQEENPRIGNHDPCSWQVDKPAALQTLIGTPTSHLTVTLEKPGQHGEPSSSTARPGYMEPTESSEAKKREKFSPSPLDITPKPPWKP